jgi:hypothetical protein
MPDPLASASAYTTFIHTLPDRYPLIRRSTLTYIPTGATFGRLEGMLFFDANLILCVQEFLNFQLGVIEGYGYELSRTLVALDTPNFPAATEYCKATFRQKEKFYWYDSFPHPHDPTLASTHPHHKHIPPNIKHHRIPAPELSFTVPNLPFLLEEIEQSGLGANL